MVAPPRHLMAGLVVALVLCAHAVPAEATEWCVPAGGCAQLLGYGAAYPGGTHRGVDLAAAPGTTVAAPTGGTVIFAGSVPADGGGTCGAVTLETADGLRVSMMPLDTMFVAEGEQLGTGDALGVLASQGDDSSGEPHLHLSVRRGDAYLDPSGFLPRGTAVSDQPAGGIPSAATPPRTPTSAGAAAPAALEPCTSAVGTSPLGEACSVTAGTGAMASAAAGSISAAGTHAVAGGRQVLQDAGMPVPSTLDPTAARPHVRRAATSTPPPVRTTTGAVLLSGMCAVAIGIAATRRAALVRVN